MLISRRVAGKYGEFIANMLILASSAVAILYDSADGMAKLALKPIQSAKPTAANLNCGNVNAARASSTKRLRDSEALLSTRRSTACSIPTKRE